MKKLLFTAIALLTVSTAVYAELTVKEKWHELQGRRFDFFDESGNRLRSHYFDYSSQFFTVRPAASQDEGFEVSSVWDDNSFKSVKVVPWGVNSYPLEVATEQEDVSVAYTTALEDTNGDGYIDYDDIDFSKINLPKATRSQTLQQDLKNGADILFTFDIPEGTYPLLEINFAYSYPNIDDEPYYYEESLPLIGTLYDSYQYFTQSWLFNAEDRQQQLEYYATNGGFYPDPKIKNRWHYLFYMPNEPMNVRVSYMRLDDTVIGGMIDDAACHIYGQQSYTQNIQAPFFNGEPWAMAKCGEAFSQDCIATMVAGSNPTLVSHEFYSAGDYWMPQIPWIYYYGMIEMANSRLYLLDNLNFSSATRVDEARAVMRALRGNAYLRILQLYAPRWEDSYNGTILVAPLCTEWGNLDLPASSMDEICHFAKADLEYAISRLDEKAYSFTNIPNADVARGLLIRLSMLCHDWQTVDQQSRILLDKYPLTTNEEMQSGFFKQNKSWIWTASEHDSRNLYYASFASSCAVNGAYPLSWNMGPAIGSIDRDLFLKISENDIRRQLFAMPENEEGSF